MIYKSQKIALTTKETALYKKGVSLLQIEYIRAICKTLGIEYDRPLTKRNAWYFIHDHLEEYRKAVVDG